MANAFQDLIPNAPAPTPGATLGAGEPPPAPNAFLDLIPKKPKNEFAELIPDPSKGVVDKVTDALSPGPNKDVGPMPGPIDALTQGFKRAIGAGEQTIDTLHGDKPKPLEPDASPAAQNFELRDLYEPSRGLSKISYGIGQSSPTLAGGLLGGVAGSLVYPGAGTVVGGAGGAATGAALQTLGPAFSTELQKNPQDPDGAWTRAMHAAEVSGAFSGASWALFPAKFFNGPVKNLAFQALGVQPGVSVAEQATHNAVAGEDLSKGLGTAYVQGAVGTAVPALGHLALSNRMGGPKVREQEPTPQQVNESVNDKMQRAADFITRAQDPNISPVQAKSFQDQAASLHEAASVELDRAQAPARMASLLQQADQLEQQAQNQSLTALQRQDLINNAFELRRNADHEGFVASLAPPMPAPSKTLWGRLRESYINDIAPEIASDAALRTDPRFAAFKARRAQKVDALLGQAEERKFQWRKMSEADQDAFLYAGETGTPLPPALVQRAPWVTQALADYRTQMAEDYRLEVQYGSKAHYIDNYFQHNWKDVGLAHQVFDSQRMIQSMGVSGFQKLRTINLIQMGKDRGLELVSNNPQDIVTNRRVASVDMINKMELLHGLERQGVATPLEQAPPQVRDAAINGGRAWQPVTSPTGEQWMIAPDVTALWKNAVEAKGLWADTSRVGDVYRSWMSLKNAWVPIKLALSLFHPVHVLHINAVNNINRALGETFGRGQQGVLRRFAAIPEALLQTLADTGTLFTSPLTHFGDVGSSGTGKRIRQSWMAPTELQTAQQKADIKLMSEAGVTANRSMELRTGAKDSLNKALSEGSYPKAILPAMKRLSEVLTGPIFEEWIPNLKVAALKREADTLLRRRPDLLTDPQNRLLALRTLGKQIDNRYGEMFYGSLFWNRTLKDASIGSFLSLGWNLGFAREFGGGFFEPIVRRMMEAPSPSRSLIRAVSNKTTNMFVYSMTAMAINAMMTKMMSGDNPQGMDYIFPRIGGLNPDGSPRRITNAFYTREIPMAMKNIEERQSVTAGLGQMLYHKMMFAPVMEMWNNKDYFGNQIMDESAPAYKQMKQFVMHTISNDLSPMSITGAQRSLELSGKPHTWMDVFKETAKGDFDAYGSLLGFGPAPAYASKSALDNRIQYLFRKLVAPESRSANVAELSMEKSKWRTAYLGAQQRGDTAAVTAAAQKLASLGVKTREILKLQPGGPSLYMFSRLPPLDKKELFQAMSPEEFKRYYLTLPKKSPLKADPEIAEMTRKYFPGN